MSNGRRMRRTMAKWQKEQGNMNDGPNGGIVLPRQINVALKHVAGLLAHPVAMAVPGELAIIGGLTKLEYAALHMATTVADWSDRDAACDEAIKRAEAISRAFGRYAEQQAAGGAPAENAKVLPGG